VTATAWVLGASGLLGTAVTRALRADPGIDSIHAAPMDWNDQQHFERQAGTALDAIASGDEDWTIYWCAGAGVVGTSQQVFDGEFEQLKRFLVILGAHLQRNPASRGRLFYASSAGAVYAGSIDPPFTEQTVPRAISPYGEAKLRAEQALQEFAADRGFSVLVGRISNLYGPDQSLDKAQGIISQLCKSTITGVPTNIYVSLDTIRDYINADDCAGLVIDATRRLRSGAEHEGEFRIKILASHQAVTLGAILGIFRSIFKRRPNAMIGSSPNAAFQVRDLSLRSIVWTDLDARHLVPLTVGVHAIWQAMMMGLSREGI
jgi:UDP-glucose 4-epimerase